MNIYGKRIFFVVVIFLCVVFLYFARLYDMQIIHGEEERDRSGMRIYKDIETQAYRGVILDRNGLPLAVNTQTYEIVVSLDGDAGHGTGRSVEGFHLASGLASMGDLLLGCGGHEMAAGLTLKASNFEAFRERFLAYARAAISPELLQPEIECECEVALAELAMPVVEQLQSLGPFGQGNPRPVFCCRDVELAAEPNVVGQRGDHLQLRLRQGTTLMKGIAFGFGEMARELRRGMRIDIAFEPSINQYNGMRSVEAEIRDIRVRS